LLEEHERLSASLAALTHHVAHVQFRLQQVISAPTAEDREVEENLQKKTDSLDLLSFHRIYLSNCIILLPMVYLM